jgi:hypothetical protein
LYRTKPFATNGDKRAPVAVGQGTATAAYQVTWPFMSLILRAASEANADAPAG